LHATASRNLHQTLVAEAVVLDGRLALFHNRQRWLAVADLHFGYEISQRAAGRLMPMWGMKSVEKRISELLHDYRPDRLIILGDLVHDRAAAAEARALVDQLGEICEVIVLAGNHDRQLGGFVDLRDSWQTDGFHFHHGHCAAETPGRTQIIGHHHPAGTVRDGAGLRLKLPAFVQQGSCWIMPAFSPWAAGASWEPEAGSRMWLCTPQRILQLPVTEPAAR
jgi:DNA ligase-associated metallophosphoesterase